MTHPLIPSYRRRLALGLDAFVQCFFRKAVLGITISARAGTAKAHGHKWGCVLCKVLDHCTWIGFGPGHCEDAIRNDRRRAYAVLRSLNGYREREEQRAR